MRKRFVYDKKSGGVVEVQPPSESATKDREKGYQPKRKSKEITDLVIGRVVEVFDEKTGKVVQVTRTRARGVAKWPIVSENAGVMPEQVAEANESIRRAGIVGVEHTPDGSVVWSDPAARRAHLKHIGAYDKSGYY
jgi:hypothetical protein